MGVNISLGDRTYRYPAWVKIEADPVPVTVPETSQFDGIQSLLSQAGTRIAGDRSLALADIDQMLDMMRESTRSHPDYMLVSPHTHWRMCWIEEYRRLGKRYPTHRKRRQRSRMGRQYNRGGR
jgi:hypothetical protein